MRQPEFVALPVTNAWASPITDHSTTVPDAAPSVTDAEDETDDAADGWFVHVTPVSVQLDVTPVAS